MIKEGKGVYTPKKRNAYKINPQNGVYGNVIIDVPKLNGQLIHTYIYTYINFIYPRILV